VIWRSYQYIKLSRSQMSGLLFKDSRILKRSSFRVFERIACVLSNIWTRLLLRTFSTCHSLPDQRTATAYSFFCHSTAMPTHLTPRSQILAKSFLRVSQLKKSLLKMESSSATTRTWSSEFDMSATKHSVSFTAARPVSPVLILQKLSQVR
jgi:hypothetical protein